MGNRVSTQLRIWLARCMIACLAWCVAFGTSTVVFGAAECEANCPCEDAAFGPWADDAEPEARGSAAGIAEHSDQCPPGCLSCDGASAAGIVVGREDLEPRVVAYFEVPTGERFDGPAHGVADGVFRPPRRAS